MRYEAAIFDLDGTLLNTLGDLADAVNYGLSRAGLPLRREDEVMAFLGNGIRRLVECAVPEGTPLSVTDRVFDDFRDRYSKHYLDRTVAYPGMPELLGRLRARGVKAAMVTNKTDPVAQEIYRALFADVLPVAIGEQPRYAKKPAPDMVEAALAQLGCSKAQAVYIGDSEVDLQTARNSGLPCILVDWGFRPRAFLETLGNDVIVSSPEALETAICGEA